MPSSSLPSPPPPANEEPHDDSSPYDLVVIGGGSGGVRSSRIAASYGAKVALIEPSMQHGVEDIYSAIGGTCVNVGCVPKKLMVYASRFASTFDISESFGWENRVRKHKQFQRDDEKIEDSGSSKGSPQTSFGEGIIDDISVDDDDENTQQLASNAARTTDGDEDDDDDDEEEAAANPEAVRKYIETYYNEKKLSHMSADQQIESEPMADRPEWRRPLTKAEKKFEEASAASSPLSSVADELMKISDDPDDTDISAYHFNWTKFQQHKNKEISRLNDIYERMLRKAGVNIIQGYGQFMPSSDNQKSQHEVTSTTDSNGDVIYNIRVLDRPGYVEEVEHAAAERKKSAMAPSQHIDYSKLDPEDREHLRRVNAEEAAKKHNKEQKRNIDLDEPSRPPKIIRAKKVVVAVGGWPRKPSPKDVPGIEHAITSNEIFYMKEKPKHMVIVGGGYIAVEFASVFANLGTKVSLIYRGELFLRGFDKDVREHLKSEILNNNKNINLYFQTEVTSITETEEFDATRKAMLLKSAELAEKHQEGTSVDEHLDFDDSSTEAANNEGDMKKQKTKTKRLYVELMNNKKGTFQTLDDVDQVMYATGRVPQTSPLHLKDAGVVTDKNGYIAVDEFSQTTGKNIFAVGDAATYILGQEAERKLKLQNEQERLRKKEIQEEAASITDKKTTYYRSHDGSEVLETDPDYHDENVGPQTAAEAAPHSTYGNPLQLTPVALMQGHRLADNLFGGGSSGSGASSSPMPLPFDQWRPVDHHHVPSAVFTTPEIASVGYSEEEALVKYGGNLIVYTNSFQSMKYSLGRHEEQNEKETEGDLLPFPRYSNTNEKGGGNRKLNYYKLLVVPQPGQADADGKVVGVHAISYEGDAGEVMQGVSVAVKMGATKRDFDETIGIHPTGAEELVTMRTPTKRYVSGVDVLHSLYKEDQQRMKDETLPEKERNAAVQRIADRHATAMPAIHNKQQNSDSEKSTMRRKKNTMVARGSTTTTTTDSFTNDLEEELLPDDVLMPLEEGGGTGNLLTDAASDKLSIGEVKKRLTDLRDVQKKLLAQDDDSSLAEDASEHQEASLDTSASTGTEAKDNKHSTTSNAFFSSTRKAGEQTIQSTPVHFSSSAIQGRGGHGHRLHPNSAAVSAVSQQAPLMGMTMLLMALVTSVVSLSVALSRSRGKKVRNSKKVSVKK